MSRPRSWRHATLVPVVWLLAATVSWFHPGDEYGLFVETSLPGVWIVFLMHVSHLRDVVALVLGTGVVVTVALGWGMDRARVPRWLWPVLLAVVATSIAVASLAPFPNLDEAVQKNGSLAAYGAAAIGVAAYLAAILATVLTLGARGLRWCVLHRRNGDEHRTPPNAGRG